MLEYNIFDGIRTPFMIFCIITVKVTWKLLLFLREQEIYESASLSLAQVFWVSVACFKNSTFWVREVESQPIIDKHFVPLLHRKMFPIRSYGKKKSIVRLSRIK